MTKDYCGSELGYHPEQKLLLIFLEKGTTFKNTQSYLLEAGGLKIFQELGIRLLEELWIQGVYQKENRQGLDMEVKKDR